MKPKFGYHLIFVHKGFIGTHVGKWYDIMDPDGLLTVTFMVWHKEVV